MPGRTVCPETGVPVYHAWTRYGCRCDVCRRAWEGDEEPARPEGTAPDLGIYETE